MNSHEVPFEGHSGLLGSEVTLSPRLHSSYEIKGRIAEVWHYADRKNVILSVTDKKRFDAYFKGKKFSTYTEMGGHAGKGRHIAVDFFYFGRTTVGIMLSVDGETRYFL